MKRVLILFAHPAFHKSRINKILVNEINGINGVTFNDLYENYPDFYINIKREQELLVNHDAIIWHHPLYWYSAPAIIKEWMDLVLEHGFAYGKHGNELEGKLAMSVISTGGKKEVYCAEGRNHFTINEFLIPFNQTAQLCKMIYLPPFVVYGSHTITKEESIRHAKMYKELIVSIRDERIDIKNWRTRENSNELFNRYV